jgi:hypothetical protein
MKFPRNPQLDEKGNPALYPGLPKFQGVAALYNTDHGEVVVIAPTLNALKLQVAKMGITDEISTDFCILSTWERITAQDIADTMPPRIGWEQ